MNRRDVLDGRSSEPGSAPRRREQLVSLRDGRQYRVRPVRPSDEPALTALLQARGPEEIRPRLPGPVRRFFRRFAGPLAESDDRRFGLVAMRADDPAEQFIASAMLVIAADNEEAEFAVLAGHDHTQYAVRRYLLECLLDYARGRRIGKVFGLVLRENAALLQLAGELGFNQRPDPQEAGCFRVELVTDTATAEAVSRPASESG